MPRLVFTDKHQRLQVATFADGKAEPPFSLHPDNDDRAFFWPCWSPVSPQIAYSAVRGGSPPVATIEVMDIGASGSGEVEVIHQTPPGVPPVIAPRVPHYVYWSPNGKKVAYVAQDRHGLTLSLHEFDSPVPSVALLNAAPVFSAWQKDSNFLLVHHGTEFGVIETDGSNVLAPVSDRSAGYRTPSAQHDGDKLAFAEQMPDGVAIKVAEYQGVLAREVWRSPGLVAFDWSPMERKLAVAQAADLQSVAFERLSLLDVEGEQHHTVFEGAFLAFFWSPDGRKLALLTPWFSDGRLVWRVVDTAGEHVCQTEPFSPSPDFQMLVAFFDQYARSHNLWSPDSRYLCFSGRKQSNGAAPMFGHGEGDQVTIVDTDDKGRMYLLAGGLLAFWEGTPLPQ